MRIFNRTGRNIFFIINRYKARITLNSIILNRSAARTILHWLSLWPPNVVSSFSILHS